MKAVRREAIDDSLSIEYKNKDNNLIKSRRIQDTKEEQNKV